MASGDVAYTKSNMSVYELSGDNSGVAVWSVTLNAGGTTSNTRTELKLDQYLSSAAMPPFDITKQYSITITEV